MKILSNYLTYYSKKVPNKDYVIVDGNKYSYKDTEIYVNKLITKLKRLNKNIKIRNQNHKLFLNHLRDDIFFIA